MSPLKMNQSHLPAIPKIGDCAPDVNLPSLAGVQIRLSDGTASPTLLVFMRHLA